MSTTYFAPEPQEQVLSTLNRDGSRRWLRPRLSPGSFLTARRIVAYFLIAIFALIPHVRIGGKPAILLDVVHRQFTFFGKTFLPTDTVLLALGLICFIVTIFLVTAIFGRAWCGYACPQTVYMEFVFRPLERFFDGPPGKGGAPGRKRTPPRILAKYATYFLVSLFLAHTFLAYFVGVDALREWVNRSPLEHPSSFLIMAVTTGLMMFNFSYFREQTCIVACPYGRLQSVLLDRSSLIVSYDPKRGEPRGKGARPEQDAGTAESKGDCVDCGLCVETCPTGIDIRDGLKMECIGCAQCVDACDSVMDKLGRPRGLIRYSSQSRIAGEAGRLIRPRVVLYPAVLCVVASLLVAALWRKQDTDVTLLRGLGMPFSELQGGEIANPARLKIVNRSCEQRAYRIEPVGPVAARIILDEERIAVSPGESVTKNLLIAVQPSVFLNGKCDVRLDVTDGHEFSKELGFRLLGPASPTGLVPAREESHKESTRDS